MDDGADLGETGIQPRAEVTKVRAERRRVETTADAAGTRPGGRTSHIAIPVRAVAPVQQRAGAMRVQPLRIGHLRVRLGELRHHAVRNAERRGIHQIPVPQHHVGHPAVTEIAEILQIPVQSLHLSRIPLAGRRQHAGRSI